MGECSLHCKHKGPRSPRNTQSREATQTRTHTQTHKTTNSADPNSTDDPRVSHIKYLPHQKKRRYMNYPKVKGCRELSAQNRTESHRTHSISSFAYCASFTHCESAHSHILELMDALILAQRLEARHGHVRGHILLGFEVERRHLALR